MGRLRRLILPVLVGLAGYYAFFGGEYSVFELRKARADAAAAHRELVRLRHVNDSLLAWVDSLETDSTTLERFAREHFGMTRPGEQLYRFTEPDSVPPDTLDGEDARR